MKTKIVASKAGIAAAGMVHTGFLPSGGTTHPLFSLAVGWNFKGDVKLWCVDAECKIYTHHNHDSNQDGKI